MALTRTLLGTPVPFTETPFTTEDPFSHYIIGDFTLHSRREGKKGEVGKYMLLNLKNIFPPPFFPSLQGLCIGAALFLFDFYHAY